MKPLKPGKRKWAKPMSGDRIFVQLTDQRRFHPFSPDAAEVDIKDIARSLARQCRFDGHVNVEHYSVAEHSIYVSELVAPEFALDGLLHDAAEAYIGDIVSPVKRATWFLSDDIQQEERINYARAEDVERRILNVVYGSLAPHRTRAVVCAPRTNDADIRLTAHEARMLQGGVEDWGEAYTNAEPLEWCLHCWAPAEAERRFLARFEELMG